MQYIQDHVRPAWAQRSSKEVTILCTITTSITTFFQYIQKFAPLITSKNVTFHTLSGLINASFTFLVSTIASIALAQCCRIFLNRNITKYYPGYYIYTFQIPGAKNSADINVIGYFALSCNTTEGTISADGHSYTYGDVGLNTRVDWHSRSIINFTEKDKDKCDIFYTLEEDAAHRLRSYRHGVLQFTYTRDLGVLNEKNYVYTGAITLLDHPNKIPHYVYAERIDGSPDMETDSGAELFLERYGEQLLRTWAKKNERYLSPSSYSEESPSSYILTSEPQQAHQ